jgi:hypothetical protein
MKSSRTLPDHYTLLHKLDLSSDHRLLVILNLVGLVMFFVFGGLFVRLAGMLLPEGRPPVGEVAWLPYLLGILAASVLVILLHELVHGLFFWLATGSQPHFGFRLAYAYAAAPGWYIPRNFYVLVGLAPLVLISLLGVALIPFISIYWLYILIFALTINASGAVGDVYIVGWLLLRPADTLVNDRGDGIWFYRPGGE